MSMAYAQNYCANIRVAGYEKWRLATYDELGSVVLDGWICEHSRQPDMGRYCKTIN